MTIFPFGMQASRIQHLSCMCLAAKRIFLLSPAHDYNSSDRSRIALYPCFALTLPSRGRRDRLRDAGGVRPDPLERNVEIGPDFRIAQRRRFEQLDE